MNDELKGFVKGVITTLWLLGIGIALWNHNGPAIAAVAIIGGMLGGVVIATVEL